MINQKTKQLSKEWETKTLGEVCKIELGKTPYRGDKTFWDSRKKTKNVWLSIADLLNGQGKIVSDSKEYISDKGAKISKIVKKGTLLVSFKLTLGRLAFAGKDLYTNEAIASLEIKNEKILFKEFLYYFLTFFDWNKATEGDIKVKGRTLNKSKLKQIKIPLPSLKTQKQIVRILDQAFKEIAKSKENTEKNLKNTKELFESYLEKIFSNPGEDWEEKRLEEVCEKTSNIKWQNFKNKEFKYIDLSAVSRIGLEIISSVSVNYENAPSRAKKIIKTNDIIFATTRPTLKRISEVFSEYDNQICSTGFTILRPNKEKIISKIIFYFLQTSIFMKNMKKLQRGASYPAVSDSDVKNQVFNFPKSLPQQKQIVQELDALSKEIKELETIYKHKIKNLDELKKSVLKKAFAGELTKNAA